MRVLRLEGGAVRQGGEELLEPGATRWLDLAPSPEPLRALGARFHFHPLALEDCLHEGQRSKLEQFDDHLFTVIHRLALAPDDAGLEAHELHAFLAPGLLVTVHSAPVPELDAAWERCSREPELLGRGPEFALYLVHDAITDLHFSLVEHLHEEIEALAEEVAGRRPEGDLLDRILSARRTHALLRRRLAPQRELFLALSRPGQALVREATALYFRDVSDHVVRLTEDVDTGRELLASSMEAALSQTNNRLTAVTTRLTLIATIFLPLNFVAGFFGMNLEILHPRLAVPVVLGLLVAMPVGMWLLFRRHGWL